jgi:hypothetical protein
MVLVGLSGLPSFAQSCSKEVIGKNREALVFITAKVTQKETGAVDPREATGFVISPSGYILTARHVIDGGPNADKVEITGAIGSRDASSSRLIVIDKNDQDVALLKFADTSKIYKTVNLGHAADAAIGTVFCAEGFPTGQEFFLANGVLSGTGGEHGFWLTSMASNPGDSGAPVFLQSGAVVAIKAGGYQEVHDINLLIPINLAQGLLGEVPDLLPAPGPAPTRDLNPWIGNWKGNIDSDAADAFWKKMILVVDRADDEKIDVLLRLSDGSKPTVFRVFRSIPDDQPRRIDTNDGLSGKLRLKWAEGSKHTVIDGVFVDSNSTWREEFTATLAADGTSVLMHIVDFFESNQIVDATASLRKEVASQ